MRQTSALRAIHARINLSPHAVLLNENARVERDEAPPHVQLGVTALRVWMTIILGGMVAMPVNFVLLLASPDRQPQQQMPLFALGWWHPCRSETRYSRSFCTS